MIHFGQGLTCPVCRLFTDLASRDEADDHQPIRCPWCGAASTLGEWARCADIDKCDACKHPKAMHACYRTKTGEAPCPGEQVEVEPAPCAHCKCTETSGAHLVRVC